MAKSMVLINREDPRYTVITLNRPSKRNALSIELMEELWEAIDETERLPYQRAMIFKGEGTVFCAGLDLEEAAVVSKIEKSAHLVAKILTSLYNSPLVTIAAVHGAALGGGAGLMCACDLALADSKTIFGFPEVRRGLVAAQLMPLFLRQLKQRDIHELLLLGDNITARKAEAIGLVNHVVENDELFPEVLKMVDLICKGAPGAIAETKGLIRQMYYSVFSEDLKKGLQVHEMARHSSEAQEGISAFLEHREPNWSQEV